MNKPCQITAPGRVFWLLKGNLQTGCSASPQGASGRRQASSVGNVRTRRAVHALVVWAGRLSSTGILAQRQSVAWVGVGGRAAPAQVLAARVPLSFATSRPARLTVARLMPKCSAVCEMLAWLAVRHATISAGWCANGRPMLSFPR